MHCTCELLKKGSVHFSAKMLAAKDRHERLCRQSNIRSRGMTQNNQKGHFVTTTLSC